MQRLLIVMAVASSLAGCLSDDGADVEPRVAHPFSADDTLTNCTDVGVSIPIELERAQALLPEPFVARPASHFMGVPTPTGEGALTVTAIECERSELEDGPYTYAEMVIAVEPPELAAAAGLEGASHSYSQVFHLGAPATAAALSSVGVAVANVTIENQGSAELAEVQGTGRITGADGILVEFTVAGPYTMPPSDTFRIVEWQRTATGLFHMEVQVTDIPLRRAKVLACTAAEGTLVHELLGTTDCATPEATGWVAPGFPVAAHYRTFPSTEQSG